VERLEPRPDLRRQVLGATTLAVADDRLSHGQKERFMIISAQVAIYPLRQERLTPAITAVSAALQAAGLRPDVGAMSTMVTGEAATVFGALADAFVQAGALGHVVMTVTVSNACPVST
jgi:uncharacterized protein YqgV (UPF0045/DUF77 family)